MVLWIVGLGLGYAEDITVRGLNAVKGCQRVYLEHYTSILVEDTAALVHTTTLSGTIELTRNHVQTGGVIRSRGDPS